MRTSSRTHRCGALRSTNIGETVRLGGWIHRRRDLGGLVFYDLRDHEGIVQVAFGPGWSDREALERAGALGAENVVIVEGVVAARPADAVNREMATGEIEVHARTMIHAGPAETPAIPVSRSKGEEGPAEELRLTHRILDLRRPEMQFNLALRHRLLQRARRSLTELGFLEIETPILTKPTPEGARDYLVPSRVHPGQFYALPQSPQIYKQLLMVAGFDRYFQIARCFRDEDQRADRQPEFTQIDLEASFVDANDIYRFVEDLTVNLWDEANEAVVAPFQRRTYAEVMERYGSDKPDLRYGLEIEDLTGSLCGRGFAPFDAARDAGHRVRGLRVAGGAALSRRQTDQFTELARKYGLNGLALLKRRGEELSGPLAKLEGMNLESAGLGDGDVLIVAAGVSRITSQVLGELRLQVIALLDLPPQTRHAFTWVEGFPLFERESEADQWTFAHHPFTAPEPDDISRLEAGDVESVRAQHYDLVYNGRELGSGSIRISDPRLQLLVLRYLGVDAAEAEDRFGFLLRALRAGAPPHGGMALGFDRIAMLLAGADNLREVIAFPKTTAARALFEDAPVTVASKELEPLGIQLTV